VNLACKGPGLVVMLNPSRVENDRNADSLAPLSLLPEHALLTTSEIDHANWNYRPILGRIQRLRFDLIRSILGGKHALRLLEIGYGSGCFFQSYQNIQIACTVSIPIPIRVT